MMGLFTWFSGKSKTEDSSPLPNDYILASKIATIFETALLNASIGFPALIKPNCAIVLDVRGNVSLQWLDGPEQFEDIASYALTKQLSRFRQFAKTCVEMVKRGDRQGMDAWLQTMGHIEFDQIAIEALQVMKRNAQMAEQTPQSETLLERIDEVGGRAVIAGYRRIAAQRGCAPTSKTSDSQIVELYKTVTAAFREVAEVRRESLPALNTNFIVLKFLQLREMFGDEVLERHLAHELDNYHSDGLRPDYREDLPLV